MHIHPAAIGQHSINTCAAGNERPAAAEVRKKLLRAARSGELEVDSDADATLLIGQWLDARHSQVIPADEYHTVSSGKNPNLG